MYQATRLPAQILALGGPVSSIGSDGGGLATKNGGVANKQNLCMIRGKNGHLVLSLIKKPDICVYLSQIKHNTKQDLVFSVKLQL